MNLKHYFQKAREEKWAIGQFNFSSLDQLKGILEAAKNMRSPVILGTSEGESGFFGLEEAVAIVKIFNKKNGTHAFLNLDHGKSVESLEKAIEAGYPAVHFDGSSFLFQENVKYAKKVVEYARKKNVLVEGEIGKIKGESSLHEGRGERNQEDLTLPEEAEEFCKEVKVDNLAVSIGNTHGIFLQGEPSIDLKRLAEIRSRVDVGLVLHGGSGIPDEEIRGAIVAGVSKININTELRIAWNKSLKNSLTGDELKPYKILILSQAAVQKKVEEKISLFGSKNKI